jgi:hypothetical protein
MERTPELSLILKGRHVQDKQRAGKGGPFYTSYCK